MTNRARDRKDDCKSCKIARREIEDLEDLKVKCVIPLGKHWTVNQYGGSPTFVGWLVMQPNCHAMSVAELCEDARADFLPQFASLEEAVTKTWNERHPLDPIERVYLLLFFEPDRARPEWHIHWHVVPRTKKMGQEDPSFLEKLLRITDHKGWYVVRQQRYGLDWAEDVFIDQATQFLHRLKRYLPGDASPHDCSDSCE